MKIVILIPVFNDFKSASKLIEEIDINISELKAAFSVIVVNDASTEEKILETKNLNNIKSLKLINMRNNKGHARCIAAGLKHISENEDFDYVIPMDGDGEDRPEEIRNFVEKIRDNPDKNIVGERVAVQPFWDDYKDELQSSVADLKNLGGPESGHITAGKFLEHFVDYSWIHLDIAGVAFLQKNYHYNNKCRRHLDRDVE